MHSIDEASRRRERYQRWAASSHPLLREIGEQLVRGQIRPTDLLTVPAYRDLIQTGLTRLQRESDRIAAERAANQAEPVANAAPMAQAEPMAKAAPIANPAPMAKAEPLAKVRLSTEGVRR